MTTKRVTMKQLEAAHVALEKRISAVEKQLREIEAKNLDRLIGKNATLQLGNETIKTESLLGH